VDERLDAGLVQRAQVAGGLARLLAKHHRLRSMAWVGGAGAGRRVSGSQGQNLNRHHHVLDKRHTNHKSKLPCCLPPRLNNRGNHQQAQQTGGRCHPCTDAMCHV
jgi:hypothetical protein